MSYEGLPLTRFGHFLSKHVQSAARKAGTKDNGFIDFSILRFGCITRFSRVASAITFMMGKDTTCRGFSKIGRTENAGSRDIYI